MQILVSARLGRAFPFQIKGDESTVDGKSWSVKDGYVQLIYLSPFHAKRFVMVVAGTSANGLYFWKPFLQGIPLGYAISPWDWTIQDGRRILPSKDILPQDGGIASRVFNAGWKRKDERSTLGKAELRDRSVLRHPPKPGVSALPSLLAGIASRYEFCPGVVALVSVREGQAFVQFPGSKVMKTTFVHDTEFCLGRDGGRSGL